MSVIYGHLQPDQLAGAYLSMVETYNDLGHDPSQQSERDKLADAMAKSLDILINNIGMKDAFELISKSL